MSRVVSGACPGHVRGMSGMSGACLGCPGWGVYVFGVSGVVSGAGCLSCLGRAGLRPSCFLKTFWINHISFGMVRACVSLFLLSSSQALLVLGVPILYW